MGEQHSARVDPASLRAVARQFEASGDVVNTAIRTQMARLAFDGSFAGRMHVAHGDALRGAWAQLADDLSAWSRACGEIAIVLRVSADRYADAEASSASRVG